MNIHHPVAPSEFPVRRLNSQDASNRLDHARAQIFRAQLFDNTERDHNPARGQLEFHTPDKGIFSCTYEGTANQGWLETPNSLTTYTEDSVVIRQRETSESGLTRETIYKLARRNPGNSTVEELVYPTPPQS